MSSVMPASSTTIRSASGRSRTCSTEARSHPARATRNRPGSTARRAGMRSGGSAASSASTSTREARRRRHRSRLAGGEAAADIERVESGPSRADHREQREPTPDRVPPRVDGTQLRPDMEVEAACAQRPVRRQPGNRTRELRLGHPELRVAVADREPRMGLGGDVRVEADQHVQRRPTPPAEAARARRSRRACRAPRGSRRQPSAAARRSRPTEPLPGGPRRPSRSPRA